MTPVTMRPMMKEDLQVIMDILERTGMFTREEIDEAAWMGIHFGGEPARLFYQQFFPGTQ